MAVESTTSRVSYTGSGTTGPFTISFYFLANADIRAIKVLISDGTETELALTTDFTLTGAGDEDGGTLTLVSSLSSSYRLVIFRDPTNTQTATYPRNDPFPAATHEEVVDRRTMVSQRTRSLVARSLRQPDGDSADIDTIPAKVARASKYLAFDADGDPIASDGSADATPISAFMATVVDDTTAANARTTLGASATEPADDVFHVVGSSDATKKFRVEVDGFTAGQTRVLTPPDANLTLPAIAAKGDIPAGTAAGVLGALTVGADGSHLFALASAATGLAWSSAVVKGTNFTRDVSAAGSAQAVTGIGFKPKAILFVAAISTTKAMSIGFADGSSNLSISDDTYDTDGTWVSNTTSALLLVASAGNNANMVLTSFDADGFTVTWSKTNSPTGTASVHALCFR
jgi:hypothetical protein